jgi:LemA protein
VAEEEAAAEAAPDDGRKGNGMMSPANIITLALAAAVGIWIILTYNRFVTLRNRCINAYSQIDIQIKKRHELIPRLVDTVSGYALHERETLEKVTAARAAAAGAGSTREKASAEEGLESAVKSLFAVAEAYPDLKADTIFLKLQRDLTRLEDDIRFSRQFYNDTVMIHNTAISTFPANLVARFTGAGAMEYFGLPG